jgi:hypothetical protein
MLVKMSGLLVVSALLASACTNSKMRAIDEGVTVTTDDQGNVKTLPIPGPGGLDPSSEFNITGLDLNKKEDVDEATKKFAESVKGLFVLAQTDDDNNRIYRIELQTKDGRVVKSVGRLSSEGEYTQLGQEVVSEKQNSEIENISVSSIKCVDTCRDLEIKLSVETADTTIEPIIKAVVETKLASKIDDARDIGVSVVSTGINDDLHSGLKRIDSSERVTSYVVGSLDRFVTYSLKSKSVNVLAIGVMAKGIYQKPIYLTMNTELLGAESGSLGINAMSFDATSNEVQTLTIKQSEEIGVTVKLGFRTPVNVRPFNSPTELPQAPGSEKPDVTAAPDEKIEN